MQNIFGFDIFFFLFSLLQEMDENEKKLKAELDNLKLQNSVDTDQSVRSHGWKEEKSDMKLEAGPDTNVSDSAILNKLEEKKKELVCYSFNHKLPFF